jgi:hypothetical protein
MVNGLEWLEKSDYELVAMEPRTSTSNFRLLQIIITITTGPTIRLSPKNNGSPQESY